MVINSNTTNSNKSNNSMGVRPYFWPPIPPPAQQNQNQQQQQQSPSPSNPMAPVSPSSISSSSAAALAAAMMAAAQNKSQLPAHGTPDFSALFNSVVNPYYAAAAAAAAAAAQQQLNNSTGPHNLLNGMPPILPPTHSQSSFHMYGPKNPLHPPNQPLTNNQQLAHLNSFLTQHSMQASLLNQTNNNLNASHLHSHHPLHQQFSLNHNSNDNQSIPSSLSSSSSSSSSASSSKSLSPNTLALTPPNTKRTAIYWRT